MGCLLVTKKVQTQSCILWYVYTVIIDIYLYTYMNIHEIEDFLVCLVLERVVF